MTDAWPEDADELVLAAIGPEGAPLDVIATRTGRTPEAVASAFHRLERAGHVETADGLAALTATGREALTGRPPATTATTAPAGATPVDLEDAVRSVSTALSTHYRGRAAASEAARDGVLASDADRDDAVRLLADALAHGRLTPEEFGDRTGRALVARTHGELDDLLQGLGGYRTAVAGHPVRKGVFAVVAFVSSPFVLVGVLLLLFGTDLDDHLFGGFISLVLLPGLFALWRWAWPRRR